MNKKFCLTPEDVINDASESSDKNENDFKVDPYVFLIFSGSLLEFLKEKAKLKAYEWLMSFHPYASPEEIFRGKYHDIPITVLIPPMGASPIATIAEDLIYCGAKVILLVCGSWGIGKGIKVLDYLIPTHGLGPDGTSIYYGRDIEEELEIDKEITKIIIEETSKRTKNYHIGKNYSKEAFYRITEEEIHDLQNRGCISMENGELNVLATISKLKNINFAAIFYNYFNPLEGWKIPWIEEKYKFCVRLEGEIALATLIKIKKHIY
ncbi:MAG: hypothetical protein ACFFHD_03870 [Promethearchaeota archaeon]